MRGLLCHLYWIYRAHSVDWESGCCAGGEEAEELLGGGGAGVGLFEGAAFGDDCGGAVGSFDPFPARGGPPLLYGVDFGGEEGVFFFGCWCVVEGTGAHGFCEDEGGGWGGAEEPGEGPERGETAEWEWHCG